MRERIAYSGAWASSSMTQQAVSLCGTFWAPTTTSILGVQAYKERFRPVTHHRRRQGADGRTFWLRAFGAAWMKSRKPGGRTMQVLDTKKTVGRKVMTQSAPLIVPYRPNACLCATVK